MKKLFPLMLAAASLLVVPVVANDHYQHPHHHPKFGYFDLTIDVPCVESLEAINWTGCGSIPTEDVFVDSNDSHRIILEHRGYYLVTYTVTGQVKNDINVTDKTSAAVSSSKFQFALYLNNCENPIPGSTYASSGKTYTLTPTSATTPVSDGSLATEIVGQAIFRVTERGSYIQLVNQSENAVDLVSTAGTNCPDKFKPNVSASVVVQRLANLDLD